MRNQFPRIAAIVFLALVSHVECNLASGQQSATSKPFMLVTWFGPGGIALPTDQEWKLEMLTVYDEGRRPVVQYNRASAGVTASFILFENLSGKPTAEGCREDAISPIVAHEAKLISKRVDGAVKNAMGETLATTSYLIDMSAAGGHYLRNQFGFAGNSKTCAEIHLSSVDDTPASDGAMKAALVDFRPDLAYQPAAIDHFRVASILFKNSPNLAVPYYKSALDAMPDNPSFITPRRIATDQLVMSLGMSGDIKDGRAVAERAVAADPDYPINYYNLACMDAEQGNATNAKAHLKQAFDRRANVLKGESMPDPTKDESILKLKKDETFWAFVVTLPKGKE